MQINTVVLSNVKVKRLSDSQIFTPIIPDPELGYYKSVQSLREIGYDINCLIDVTSIRNNSTRFEIFEGELFFCEWCNAVKENNTGMCTKCHRFPALNKKLIDVNKKTGIFEP